MRTKALYRCSKRGIGVTFVNYCDWFEKKRATLTKRCCKNCRYFTDEQVKQDNTTKNVISPEKKAETEIKKPKK